MSKKRKARKKKAKPRVGQAGSGAQRPAQPKEAQPSPKKTAPAKAKGGSLGDKMGGGPAAWWATSAQFFREVKVELKKVTWPSRKEAVASTSVVVVLVLLASVFLGLVDLGLSRLIRAVIG